MEKQEEERSDDDNTPSEASLGPPQAAIMWSQLSNVRIK